MYNFILGILAMLIGSFLLDISLADQDTFGLVLGYITCMLGVANVVLAVTGKGIRIK